MHRPSAGHFVAVRCPFSKIRVDQEESQTKRDGRTDDGGAARGRERDGERGRQEGAILLPAHFTTLDTAKFAIRRNSCGLPLSS